MSTLEVTYLADGVINVWKVGRMGGSCLAFCTFTTQKNRGKSHRFLFWTPTLSARIGFSIAGKEFPNKVLARQQAKLVKSLFQTGVRDGLSTFGVQGEGV